MAKNKQIKGILEYLLASAITPITLILLLITTAILITPSESRGERKKTEIKESQ